VDFSGIATGEAQVTLGYDASLPMSSLVLHTFSDGKWTRATNHSFDPVAGTISLTATDVSSAVFLLGVPEPAGWTFALIIASALVIHRRATRSR
jgi:hypothetical protein